MQLFINPLRTILLLSLWLLILTACGEAEQDIPFETIENSTHSHGQELYRGTEPTLVVAFTSQEIAGLAPYVSPTAVETLEAIDFPHSLAIGIFQGLKGMGPYEVIVDKVVFENEALKIYASFLDPEDILEEVILPAETSEYEVIVIEKLPQLAGKNVTFMLIANGKTVVQQQYNLP